MRDVYPPRITLDFKLVGADGNVLAQGTRELSDIAYLQRGSPLADSDQLRYEKRLIADWMRKELRAPEACSAARPSARPVPRKRRGRRTPCGSEKTTRSPSPPGRCPPLPHFHYTIRRSTG